MRSPARICSFILVALLPLLMVGCSDDHSGGRSSDESLSDFMIAPGFSLQLLAAEPLIADPIDMEIDEYGRLYVLEMHGYPLDKSGIGKIKMLEDRDGDGQMDHSILFADNLTFPFGILRWKKGLLVADAPDILYLEDTDGDGVADIREVVLTGFAFSNAQMNVGNPMYSLDNWIYLTSESGRTYQLYKEEFGDLGGMIRYPGSPDVPGIPLTGSGRTVRFRPDRGELELTSGMTQFGHGFDEWGRHILGVNFNHVYHEVIAANYLRRNPFLSVPSATESMSDHGSVVLSLQKNPAGSWDIVENMFTAACGNLVYSGGVFPPPYDGTIHFVAEPVSNTVHVDKIASKGVTLSASRLDEKMEFLTSTDSWFRPVNMYTGPDGALYVVDYYRQVIEHPEWMSEEQLQEGGLYNGNDRGRIYRVVPNDAPPADWTKGLRLGDASPQELVLSLTHPNGWWRTHAQRLLVDNAPDSAVPLLKTMVSNVSPLGRLHALWALEGMGKLEVPMIELALRDSVAGIRENAIKLAELHYEQFPQLEGALLSLYDDPDDRVRFQLLCTLGFFDSPAAFEVRKKLLFDNMKDQWFRIAALSASSSQSVILLDEVLKKFAPEELAYASIVRQLMSVVGASEDPAKVREFIGKAVSTYSTKMRGWEASALLGIAEGLRRREDSVSLLDEGDKLIRIYFEHTSADLRKASLEVMRVSGIDSLQRRRAIQRAVSIAENRAIAVERRSEAIAFLAIANPAGHLPLLRDLLDFHEPQEVQQATIKVLGVIPGITVANDLLSRWSTFTSEVRRTCIDALLLDTDRVGLLLDSLDSGAVTKSAISAHQASKLMGQRDPYLRRRARAMFAADKGSDVTQRYAQALTLKGNMQNGKAVFTKNCSMCHQVRGGDGVSYGPDLGTVQNWKREAVMTHILSPNLSIAAGFELWIMETLQDDSFQGIIVQETPTAITLSMGGVEQRTINRQDIRTLQSLDISGMPAGWEHAIDEQQMADLLTFLLDGR